MGLISASQIQYTMRRRLDRHYDSGCYLDITQQITTTKNNIFYITGYTFLIKLYIVGVGLYYKIIVLK